MIRVPVSPPVPAQIAQQGRFSTRLACNLLLAQFLVVFQSDVARATEARAFTYAYSSKPADGIRHSASGPNVAAPEAATALAGGGFGFASAYAAGTREEAKARYAPALQVRAYGRAGGDDHAVGGGGSATASWTDRLSYYSVLLKSAPTRDFLRMLVIFQFHVSGSILGPIGASRCGYSLTIEAMDEDGEPVRYGRNGSFTVPGGIHDTREIGIPISAFNAVTPDMQLRPPQFTMSINVSADSAYDTKGDWIGDGEANFGSTFALDAIYLADEHGNPLTAYSDFEIRGENGPYLMGPPPAGFLGEIGVFDRFGRRLNEHGMTLVDWEGQIANPAVGIEILPPPDTTFPAVATITSPQPRLYFDEPSEAGASGPSKTMVFTNGTPQTMRISIFPDADGEDEDWPVNISFKSANGAIRTLFLNAHVLDQDQPQRGVEFPITVDFSQDRTGFFAEESRRELYQRLANDWAYYFADPGIDAVPAGKETTFIWNPTGFDGGTFIKNASLYRGYLLYAYGIDQVEPPFRSGGEPSTAGGFLTVGGKSLNLRRSGGHELEVKGNFNLLGWFLSAGDDDWWRASNLGDVQNDLASIPHHEIGHALIFNPAQPGFAGFKSAGRVEDPRVQAYHGSYPAIDAFDHLSGAIDRLSGKGAFGYEYYGFVPARRWLITKLDLLVAQAIGYPLRQTSPFLAPRIATAGLPRGWVDGPYSQTLNAEGGVPFYRWTVAAGSLPPGLILDSFTGRISGTPTAAGLYPLTVRVEDYDSSATPAESSFNLLITDTSLEITEVRRAATEVQVSFRTLPGHTYRLEYSDDLLTWGTVVSGVVGTGGVATGSDPSGIPARQRFYRVVEL